MLTSSQEQAQQVTRVMAVISPLFFPLLPQLRLLWLQVLQRRHHAQQATAQATNRLIR